jgi:uncharacterized DUF497 family protein
MKVTWDPMKARANLAKHGVRFSDAESVLFDPGAHAMGRVLTVAYSYQEEVIRMISARQASRKERRAYEEGV